MKNFILIISIFLCANLNFAQTKSAVKLKNLFNGKVKITKDKLKSTIDLREDVAGCAFSIKKTDCSAPPATFTLIDTTEIDKQIYLLILSEAMGNCNVCGHNGAGNNFSLIWINLDKNLKLLKKKNVFVEYNWENVSVLKPKPKSYYNLTIWKPKFIKDTMIVEFEKADYETDSYDFSHLEYNRKTPEKAFVIKTEKRKKSSAKN